MKALAAAPQLSAQQRGFRSRAAPPPPAAPTAGTWRLERRQPCVRAAAAQQDTAPAAAQEQEEQALLQGVTEGTELAGATLAVAYDAQKDGWSADAFHAKVDGRGPALVVALTGERVGREAQPAGSSWARVAAHPPGRNNAAGTPNVAAFASRRALSHATARILPRCTGRPVHCHRCRFPYTSMPAHLPAHPSCPPLLPRRSRRRADRRLQPVWMEQRGR